LKRRTINCYLGDAPVHTLDTSSLPDLPVTEVPVEAKAPSMYDFSKPFTVTAWVRTTKGGTIFARTPPGNKHVQNSRCLYIQGGRVFYDIGHVGTVQGKKNVADGKWHHVVLVARRQRQMIYVDGKLDASGTLPHKPDIKGAVGMIGYTCAEFPKPSHFTGLLDEVCLYHRPLQKNQVAAAATKPPPNGLVGYWKFDGNWQDSSGRNNHASKHTGAKFVNGKVGKALQLNGNGSVILGDGG